MLPQWRPEGLHLLAKGAALRVAGWVIIFGLNNDQMNGRINGRFDRQAHPTFLGL